MFHITCFLQFSPQHSSSANLCFIFLQATSSAIPPHKCHNTTLGCDAQLVSPHLMKPRTHLTTSPSPLPDFKAHFPLLFLQAGIYDSTFSIGKIGILHFVFNKYSYTSMRSNSTFLYFRGLHNWNSGLSSMGKGL